jgi:hypothetical protein
MSCSIDPADGLCQCGLTVETTKLFSTDAEVASINNVLSMATTGAFPPNGSGEPVSGITDTITKYTSGGILEADSVFKVVDSFGRTQYRKNIVSKVTIGESSLKFRNPVGFFSMAEFNTRDARYELEAALEHYFYHQNTAPFLAIRLAQRFGISNPSPRYVQVISSAFTSGYYQGIGSGKYGCLKATTAAILLDRESTTENLDMDPTQ